LKKPWRAKKMPAGTRLGTADLELTYWQVEYNKYESQSHNLLHCYHIKVLTKGN